MVLSRKSLTAPGVGAISKTNTTAKFESQPVRLLLATLDLSIPVMNGLDAAQALQLTMRRVPHDCAIPEKAKTDQF
jgi:hypothetical protein